MLTQQVAHLADQLAKQQQREAAHYGEMKVRRVRLLRLKSL